MSETDQKGSPWARIAVVALVLAVFGAASVTLTFYLVSLVPEGRLMTAYGAQSDAVQPFWPRYRTWVGGLLESAFTDWGWSPTAPDIAGLLRERLPVTMTIGISSWALGWVGGLVLGAVLAARAPRLARLHVGVVYPTAQAVPPLVVVVLVYVVLMTIDPDAPDRHGLIVSIGILGALLIPASTALWYQSIDRVLRMEFIRVVRTQGISAPRIWMRHVLPNAVASSGILTQAAFSLAGLVVGSIFVEKAFSLGGIAEEFIGAVQRGQCELAASASLVYYLPLAFGVALAEGVVAILDPQQVRGHDE